jgi:hypothetical protein
VTILKTVKEFLTFTASKEDLCLKQEIRAQMFQWRKPALLQVPEANRPFNAINLEIITVTEQRPLKHQVAEDNYFLT